MSNCPARSDAQRESCEAQRIGTADIACWVKRLKRQNHFGRRGRPSASRSMECVLHSSLKGMASPTLPLSLHFANPLTSTRTT